MRQRRDALLQGGRRLRRFGVDLRRDQRGGIDLAVDGHRQLRDRDESIGDHRSDQPICQEAAQLVTLDGNRLGDHECHEVWNVSVTLLSDHGSRAYAGVSLQVRGNLSRLDPNAEDLDLIVESSGDDQGAVIANHADVAGSVDDVIGIVAKRILHEDLVTPRIDVPGRAVGGSQQDLAAFAGAHSRSPSATTSAWLWGSGKPTGWGPGSGSSSTT